ncbi:dual specificity protein phosphatase [uncultured Vibrio sp.]|uniref:dual specificity protein phosphatase family protein n=1 Tax=uncultured Vibrio sp. TaxID=114054 RepID=UPI002603D5BF|nr:dual specificity protein phosphatase [uncultured Vibrio sp.]
MIISPVYERDAAHLVANNIGSNGQNLYLGGYDSARDQDLHKELGITTIVNCAVNLDINYANTPYLEQEGAKLAAGCGGVRTYKMGLIDGPGNPHQMILAGYYLLDGAFNQILPNKPSYPTREQGNVLIHCRGGRSRSVAIASLFMHRKQPELYPTLQSAIDAVRERRELRSDEWFETPKPSLIEAIEKANAMLDLLDEHGFNN